MRKRKNESPVEDAQEFMDLFGELPPVIARSHVEKFFGGLFSRKTLANMDARGQGPDVSYAVGKNIVYRRDALLRWIVSNYDVKKLHTIKDAGA
ncbi:MAG: hypothetical protein K2O70_03035 [Desulfovibrionaceae bacterium]|nr:hypothetical protein [Desulfovibrionaceae bacterium]